MTTVEAESMKSIEDSSEKEKVTQSQIELIRTLESAGHRVHQYPNGLIVGVRLDGLRSTRGVHIDVVYILDMDFARFGKGAIAMQASILEIINQPLEKVLSDVGLVERLDVRHVGLPRRKVPIRSIRSSSGKSCSMLHDTMTVYVVSDEVRPSRDLSWLTDSSRLVTKDGFALAYQSDLRSRVPELESQVSGEKWDVLNQGILRGLYSMLALAFSILGASIGVYGLIAGEGSVALSLGSAALSGIACCLLFISSQKMIDAFKHSSIIEETGLNAVGDKLRIEKTYLEYGTQLNLLGDLGFSISSLMIGAADALATGDLPVAATSMSMVVDECVRMSPGSSESDTEALLTGDKGLERFLGLFRGYGSEEDTEYTGLALVYTEILTLHMDSLNEDSLISHLSALNNHLFEIGAIRADAKDAIDELLIRKATDEWIQESLEFEEKARLEEAQLETDRLEAECQAGEQSELTELNDEIASSSVDEVEVSSDEVHEEEIEHEVDLEDPIIETESVIEMEPEIDPDSEGTKQDRLEDLVTGADVAKRIKYRPASDDEDPWGWKVESR
ncbi:MAG: hypothetical protein RTU30_06705 [Candidatus Thorarchaeota archaeon]